LPRISPWSLPRTRCPQLERGRLPAERDPLDVLMSAQDVELVRELYRRVEPDQGFPDDLIDPEIEYVNPADAVEPGIRRGREAFHAAINRVIDVYGFEVAPEEFIDAGGVVVVLLTTCGRSAKAGRSGFAGSTTRPRR
jgi:hypothetical protein